jgi:hypothetical protein
MSGACFDFKRSYSGWMRFLVTRNQNPERSLFFLSLCPAVPFLSAPHLPPHWRRRFLPPYERRMRKCGAVTRKTHGHGHHLTMTRPFGGGQPSRRRSLPFCALRAAAAGGARRTRKHASVTGALRESTHTGQIISLDAKKVTFRPVARSTMAVGDAFYFPFLLSRRHRGTFLSVFLVCGLLNPASERSGVTPAAAI